MPNTFWGWGGLVLNWCNPPPLSQMVPSVTHYIPKLSRLYKNINFKTTQNRSIRRTTLIDGTKPKIAAQARSASQVVDKLLMLNEITTSLSTKGHSWLTIIFKLPKSDLLASFIFTVSHLKVHTWLTNSRSKYHFCHNLKSSALIESKRKVLWHHVLLCYRLVPGLQVGS